MTKRIISLVLTALMLATVCLGVSSCGLLNGNDSIVGEWYWAYSNDLFVEFYEDYTGQISYQGSAFSDMTWEYRDGTIVITIAEYEDLHQSFDTLRIKHVRCKNGCLFGVMDDSQQTLLLEVFDSTSRADKFVKAIQDNYESMSELYTRTYTNEDEAYGAFMDYYMDNIVPSLK